MCLEQMDFLIDGDAGDLLQSVVPLSAKSGILNLEDVIKVTLSFSRMGGVYRSQSRQA